MNLCLKKKNLYICDLSVLHNFFGFSYSFDPRLYVNSDLIFSMDFLPHIAKQIVDIISSIKGIFKKCLIFDLDNTIWGGVIGDDGIERIQIGDLGIGKAFTDLQTWIISLKNRGVILAVCSKNDEKIAKEPFKKHSEMILKLDDIAIFVANWENKADNIKYIQEVLNIGFNSIVFIDDNPFEREKVKREIPEICVPDLPEDPALYLSALLELNLFETSSFTLNDEIRTRQYQQEAQRKKIRTSFANDDDYLKSLAMQSAIRSFDKYTIPRAAQLLQRSNQFNLRTIRYTEDDLFKISKSNAFEGWTFDLKDKFGDNGIVSVVIVKKENTNDIFIDSWVMSCRVFKRGLEHLIVNYLVSYMLQNQRRKIIGEYIPTRKNSIVKDLYKDLGFKESKSLWILQSSLHTPLKCHIKIAK